MQFSVWVKFTGKRQISITAAGAWIKQRSFGLAENVGSGTWKKSFKSFSDARQKWKLII